MKIVILTSCFSPLDDAHSSNGVANCWGAKETRLWSMAYERSRAIPSDSWNGSLNCVCVWSVSVNVCGCYQHADN